MRRIHLSLIGTLILTGCPGSIDDPTAFCLSDDCSPIRVQCVVAQTCATSDCHHSAEGPAAREPAAGFDLGTNGEDVSALRSRLQTLNSNAEGCETEPIIDAEDSAQSYILAKLRGDNDICGVMMPFVASLAAGDIECLSSWINGDLEEPPPSENDGDM